MVWRGVGADFPIVELLMEGFDGVFVLTLVEIGFGVEEGTEGVLATVLLSWKREDLVDVVLIEVVGTEEEGGVFDFLEELLMGGIRWG